MRPTLCLALMLAGCHVPEPPGDAVGTYTFIGTLTEHTCGTFAVPAQSPLQLTAEIRTEADGLAYWQTRGGLRITGTLLDDTYRFHVSQQLVLINAQPSIGYPGCIVTREDVIVLEESPDTNKASQADAGTDAGSDGGSDGGTDGGVPAPLELEGINTAEFAPLPGTNCTPALAVEGGPFQALPCRVEYDMTGFLLEE